MQVIKFINMFSELLQWFGMCYVSRIIVEVNHIFHYCCFSAEMSPSVVIGEDTRILALENITDDEVG